MQSSMCLPRLPNLHVVYSSKPRTPTLVTLQLPVPLFGCTSCSALCLQLATFCSVLCHSFFNQGGVISTCLGALFRPRWLRQPAGRGDVLNLSFPVWSRDVVTVVRHQWYITARCTRAPASRHSLQSSYAWCCNKHAFLLRGAHREAWEQLRAGGPEWIGRSAQHSCRSAH